MVQILARFVSRMIAYFRPRRLAYATVALTILLGIVPSVSATFSDVGAGTPNKAAIESLQGGGIVEGYSDGTYKPRNRINRAEFLKIVMGSVFAEADAIACDRARNLPFSDVEDSEWFTKFLCLAVAKGIVSGYPDRTFRPDRDINFVEAAKIITLAYKQQLENTGGEWFEPYARALEASKAIPLSINGLDQKITRGEMAEIMWRLREKRTDQPSKSLLNVKRPELSVNLALDTVQNARSCRDLQAIMEESAKTTGYGRVRMMDDVFGAPAPMTGAKAAESSALSRDYSRTNVQVEGIDEADIVKTDGTYLYAVNAQKVRIVQATPATDLKLLSTIEWDDNSFTPTDLYLDGDHLIVLGNRWIQNPGPVPLEGRMMAPSTIMPGPWWNSQKAEVRIYSVADRSNPRLARSVIIDGSTVSSRKVGSKLYLVTQNPMVWMEPMPRQSLPESDLLPQIQDSLKGFTAMPVERCTDVAILPHVPSPEYLTVAVIPTDGSTAEIKRETILGSAENIYASLENLYVATTQWNYVWDARNPQSTEKTNLYRFAFTTDGVDLAAQGSVPGHIKNQFSMDERENHFRVTTTKGQSWDSSHPSTNNLYVLNMALAQVGAIEDIAPGESIYATRFLGDRAYMVTFQKIDPFFVIDMRDPRNPKILGKLKIPGYSDYLHPYDEDHIIGFGKEAVAAKEGNFAWYQGMKVALFDVSDVSDPKELHKVTIGDRGTDSPLLSDHKALLFDRERNLLAFPVTVAKIPDSQKTGPEGSAYGSPVFQGAYVYDLTLKDGFKLRGTITHYGEDAYLKAGDYWYPSGRDVQRIVRIGSSLYTLSDAAVQSHTEETVKLQDELEYVRSRDTSACPSESEGATYVSRDPEECTLMQFMCIATMKTFTGACGCGCEPI